MWIEESKIADLQSTNKAKPSNGRQDEFVIRNSKILNPKDMAYPARLVFYSIRSGCWW
jgi:hypothetical protein